ncbi:hypothetical protein CN265_06715 [Priestia megaterium]|nr:hypothetical protein CN265_06715 [Priestia megaterium]PFK02453.1 hypothetical protein COI96_08755 [Priestia megaterium]PFQ87110.1 hypothetical protein COK11_00165 [Priestia megaterium]PFW44389.1 hypothetical protein COL17_25550 [Priestia megaterium]PGY49001.1 hypothetical protein COE35_26465 [Priestia megaterium]
MIKSVRSKQDDILLDRTIMGIVSKKLTRRKISISIILMMEPTHFLIDTSGIGLKNLLEKNQNKRRITYE